MDASPTKEPTTRKLLGVGTTAGAAIYSMPMFLNYIYDFLILNLYNSFIWRCSTQMHLLPLFQKHTSKPAIRVLDIGAGTGYYPTKTNLDAASTLLLVDLNQKCLDAAAERSRTQHPQMKVRTLHTDVLDPAGLETVLRQGPFDVISCMYLLHCLPGPVERKATFLKALSAALEPEGGVLFGSTILGHGNGVHHEILGRAIMQWHNRAGIFDNEDDDLETIVNALNDAFDDVYWKIEGVVLIFEAKGSKH